jgi:uncharacterized membrane protein YhaH (DUF805 family)
MGTMSLDYILTRFEGRSSRKHFWIGIAILLVFGAVVLVAAALLTGERDYSVIRFNIFAIEVALLYPLVAVSVKRLHDRGRPGYSVLAFLVPWILHQVTNMAGITGDPLAFNAIDVTSFLVTFVLFVWFLIELGFRRGIAGANEYGPDPLETTS